MPMVTVQASNLTAEQKMRVGNDILDALQREGIPAATVVILSKNPDADIFLGGDLLIQPAPNASIAPASPVQVIAAPAAASPMAPAPVLPSARPDFLTRARRTKKELKDLKSQLLKVLQTRGALSSFEAQAVLGLKDVDWAPATLRRLFAELEEEGAIGKQGQKRGTRYVWKGITSAQPSSQASRLVKRQDEESADPDELEPIQATAASRKAEERGEG